MKKYTTLILLICLINTIFMSACANNTDEVPVSTAGTIALPEDEKIVESVTDNIFIYDIYQTYAEVAAYIGENDEAVVPPSANDVPIKSIGKNAFAYNENIKKVTLLEGITNIANYSFTKCLNLEEINFPNGLISIGTYAFRGTKLALLEFPDTLTYIGKYAFAETQITTVSVPASIVRIDDYVFSGCQNLTGFELPPTLKTIPKRMFYSCPSLETVVIPDTVTEIGDYAFSYCANLKNITIPATVTKLGEGVLYSSPNVSVITPAGSAAEKYVKNYGINYNNR